MVGIPITPVGHFAHALFPLIVLAVLLRLVGRRSDPSAPWSTTRDLMLAAGCGLTASLLSTLWMDRYFVHVAPLTASDFGQYCESVSALREGTLWGWARQRSVVAGALPSFLARHLGIIDGLQVAALLSHATMGAGIYLWARALHSRLAGVVAALLVCSVAPLVHLTRTVTFYPEAVSAYVLSAAGAALAIRYRTLPAILAGAIGVGWVLLVDVRGLIWALPALGVLLVATVFAKGIIRRVVALGLIAGVLWGSFGIGTKTSWEETPSLEQQAAFYVDEALRRYSPDDPNAGINIGEVVYDSRFIWGRTPIEDIPATLEYLWTLKQKLPAGIAELNETRYTARTQVMPWVFPGFIGLLLALWGVRRRPLLAFGVLGSATPFVVALNGSVSMVGHSRYIANGITLAPVLLGIGFAVVAAGGLGSRDEPLKGPLISRSERYGLVAMVLLVLGIIPSWISPASTWRAPIRADVEPTNSLLASASSEPLPSDISPRCAKGIRADMAAGYPAGSRLLGWTASPKQVESQ